MVEQIPNLNQGGHGKHRANYLNEAFQLRVETPSGAGNSRATARPRLL